MTKPVMANLKCFFSISLTVATSYAPNALAAPIITPKRAPPVAMHCKKNANTYETGIFPKVIRLRG